MATVYSKENISMLLKEALLLSQQLGEMDRKVDAELRARNGKLASFIHDFEEGHPLEAKATDKALDHWVKDPVEEKIKVELVKILAKVGRIAIPTLEKGAKIGGWVWGVSAQILEPVNKGAEWQKQVYFDDHVRMGNEYDAKVKRLAEITKVLMSFAPMQPWNLTNTCQIQQCYRSFPQP